MVFLDDSAILPAVSSFRENIEKIRDGNEIDTFSL
jgi:hypothetical protein